MEDTLHEEPIPEYEEIVLLGESHDALMEKAGDVQSLMNVMQDQGGVSKQNAADIEFLQPGVITEKMPLNGFTAEPSLTNRTLAMESAELVAGMIHYALIAGAVIILAKVIHWIWKAFKDNGTLCQGAAAGRARAKALVETLHEQLHKFHTACCEFPEAYMKKTSEVCADVLVGSVINTPDAALKAITAYEKKVVADSVKGQATTNIALAAHKPAEYAVRCKGVEATLAALIEVGTGMERLEHALSNASPFLTADHEVKWPFGIKSRQEADAFRKNDAKYITDASKDASEPFTKMNVNQLLAIELHLDELGRIDPNDSSLSSMQQRVASLGGTGTNVLPEHAKNPEVKRVIDDWKELSMLLGVRLSCYRAMAVDARRFSDAVVKSTDVMYGVFEKIGKHVVSNGKGTEGTHETTLNDAKKEIEKILAALSAARKNAPRV